jgi:hypothetical protein
MTTPSGATRTTPCPSCTTPKPCRHYLCGTCWAALPNPARRALNRRDGKAYSRLHELHNRLDTGVPLAEIHITP